MAMVAKCCVILACSSRHLTVGKRRQIFTLVEACSTLYRTIAPIPVWYCYFVAVTNSFSGVTASLCGGMYLAIKVTATVERCKYVGFVGKGYLKGEATYGKFATAEQLEAHQGGDCSICQGQLDGPISLPCGHLFCEECVSEWLDREPTCPLCRSQVTPGRFQLGGSASGGDGSTSLLPLLF